MKTIVSKQRRVGAPIEVQTIRMADQGDRRTRILTTSEPLFMKILMTGHS